MAGQINFARSRRLAAALLLRRLDSLSLADTGSFWHANGQELPW